MSGLIKINNVTKILNSSLKIIGSVDNTPSYSLSRSTSNTNEGTTVTYTLNTINVAENTIVSYVITGISQADLSSGSLTGNFVINSAGTSTVSFGIANDNLTEGTETMLLSAGGQSLNITINDTSLTPSVNSSYSYYLASRQFVGIKPDGTWDNEQIPASPDLVLGTGNFTIQYWCYAVPTPGQTLLLVQTGAGFNNFNVINRTAVTGTGFTSPYSPLNPNIDIQNTWRHIAYIRQGTFLRLYINGSLKKSMTNTTNYNNPNSFYLAGLPDAHTYAGFGYVPFVGSINNFSITKGTALYTTATFTPPPMV